MKKGEKIFVAIVVILIIVLIIVGINSKGKKSKNIINDNEIISEFSTNNNSEKEEFVSVLSDGTKLNTSEALSQEKNLGNLSFKNIQLTNSKGQSIILADVTNIGSASTELKEVKVIILDKDENEIGNIVGVVMPLQPGQSTQFNSSAQADYTNAYDFKIVESK